MLSWKIEDGLLEYYKTLIRLRKTRPAFSGAGEGYNDREHPAVGSVLVLERKIVNDHVFIFLNFSPEPARVADLRGESYGRFCLGGGGSRPGRTLVRIGL